MCMQIVVAVPNLTHVAGIVSSRLDRVILWLREGAVLATVSLWRNAGFIKKVLRPFGSAVISGMPGKIVRARTGVGEALVLKAQRVCRGKSFVGIKIVNGLHSRFCSEHVSRVLRSGVIGQGGGIVIIHIVGNAKVFLVHPDLESTALNQKTFAASHGLFIDNPATAVSGMHKHTAS